jgi:Family of unknown function (DUF6445)
VARSGTLSLFAFNQNANVELARIGRHGIKVTLIDNVLRDPLRVAGLGFAAAYSADSSNLYPGLRAAMPASFSTAFRDWLTPILQQQGVLGPDQAIQRDVSYYSFVSTASRDLLPLQCIPHFDSTDAKQLAAVIYLCDTRFGGTAFYRHRRTGYEEITPENLHNYQLALNSDMRVHGAPPNGYINGDTVLFETLFASELKFNSAIVYPGRALHAAKIANPFESPQAKNDWRLTVTALLHT